MTLRLTCLRRLMRQSVCGVLTLGMLSGASATLAASGDQTRWVSDHLSTYVRSGPTDGHRIVGTLKSGQAVQLLGTQNDYSQIRSDKGDVVWIRSNELQNQAGPIERVPALQQQVDKLTEQLAHADQNWQARIAGLKETSDARKVRIDELEASRRSLDEQLTRAQSDMRTAQSQLGNERQATLMRFFAYGGAVAGGGVLLGLILPHFARSRKRRNQLL